MRVNYNSEATIKRIGASSGGKSSYSSVAGVVRGFFKPIDPSPRTEALGVIGQAYEFTVDGRQDIRTSDKLTIDSVEYLVAGIARYKTFSHDFLKVTLGIQKNG